MTHERAKCDADPVERALSEAASVLPDQGPMGVFIHHNTLHAFQSLPFHDGVVRGAACLRARPYPALRAFREWWADGRIEQRDLDIGLRRTMDRLGASDSLLKVGCTRHAWWRLAWLHECHDDEAGEHIGSAASAVDADLLEAARRHPPAGGAPLPWRRHRDALMSVGIDSDVPVHMELIRLVGAFLDHGQALEPMPGREAGLLVAALRLIAAGPRARAFPMLRIAARRWLACGASARQLIDEALHGLGVPDDARESFVLATLLALPGWGGMVSRMERHPREAPMTDGGSRIAVRLEEFLALRLALDLYAIPPMAADGGLPLAWSELRRSDHRAPRSTVVVGARLLQSMRESGIEPALDEGSLAEAWLELGMFDDTSRRACGLEALEAHYRRRLLEALAYARAHRTEGARPSPAGQFIFCIDEREESMRRAIEEHGAEWSTYGAAGFFGMAIDYRGLEDHEAAPHCPVVVTPGHEVHELVDDEAQVHQRRVRRMGAWKRLETSIARRSRGLLGGAGASLLVGPVAAVFAALRVMAPRDSATALKSVQELVAPRPLTDLGALRDADRPQASSGKPLGFTPDEAADRVAALLRAIGLSSDFAPVVIVLGHGSTSLNNPHESAHDCGACGGRRGGANARLFADVANRPEVRVALRQRGIDIPAETWFVGALHDTADDRVDLFDLDRVPSSIRPALGRAMGVLELARRDNALERSRRFETLPLDASPEHALRHVQGRSTHLGQPRPEYGHCTNASCIVGRRSLSRGLHLDRRTFLVSYDPTTDPDASILERVLAAVGPVGAGISLEYYFSSVDNDVLGCGTKLPHNVTGWIGIMNGHQSDLRTGLPRQMVELHEPMRLLLVVEATPASLLQVASRQPEVRELVLNQWVQLVSVDPGSGEMHEWVDGGFVPCSPDPIQLPRRARSSERNREGRGHLDPAWIEGSFA